MLIQSVLARAAPGMVRSLPYPHLVLENTLSDDLYEALSAQYPATEIVTRGQSCGSNRARLYGLADVRRDNRISPLWVEFLSYHVSRPFYDDVLRIFGDYLESASPRGWREMRIGRHHIDGSATLYLDAQLGINTPVVMEASAVRSVHVDARTEVYNSLLYFRQPDDDADGGEFLVCEPDGSGWAVRTRVPYRANTLVFFINGPAAWHAVSPREPGLFPRRFSAHHAELGANAPLYQAGNGWSRYPKHRTVIS